MKISAFSLCRRALSLSLLAGATFLATVPAQAQSQTFRLQVLHASDLEGGVAALDDAPRFSAVVSALRPLVPNTITVSSGDNYISGPFFAASGDPSLAEEIGVPDKGRGDIVIANALGFQASAFGNHEFDENTPRVASLIGAQGAYPGAAFPYLSSNLDFSGDSSLRGLVTADGQEAATIPRRIARTTIITVNGERIGIVGATTPQLPRISSPGGVRVFPANENDFDALAAIIQTSVDALKAGGINKIILLAHMQQIDIERTLSTKLRDVDIIIAGGSNTLLADSTDRLRVGDSADGPYPILGKDADGKDIAVVNTDGNYKYVGRLVITFDAAGNIVPSSVDAAESGAYATDDAGVSAVGGTPIAKVVEVTDALRAVIAAKEGATFGRTAVYLNGLRGSVRTEETNFGNLSADANLFAGRQADATTVLSLKNGGGIRDSIGAISEDGERIPPVAIAVAGKRDGDISQLDIENSLRFNNALSLVTVTAAQLKRLAENGVAGIRPGATPGSFAQIGGFRFSFDPINEAPGSRIRTLFVDGPDGTDVIVAGGKVVGDPGRTFRMVTLSFLASGGDGYPFPEFATENPQRFNRVDLLAAGTPVVFETPGAEQFALANYTRTFFSDSPYNEADTEIPDDQRIVRLANNAIGLGVTLTPFGPKTNDVLTATPLTFEATGLTFSYRFTVNGVEVQDGPTNTLDLSRAGQGDAGDKVAVTVTALRADGNSGAAGNSARIVNSAPSAANVSGSGDTGRQISVFLSGSDDDNEALTFRRVGGPVNGVAEIRVDTQGRSVLFYTSRQGFGGNETIRYVAVDGSGRTSNVASATIAVRNPNPPRANRAPIANSTTAFGTSGQQISIPVTGADPDRDPITFVVVGAPTNGVGEFVTAANGQVSFVYTSRTDFRGTEVVRFVTQDDKGLSSRVSTIAIGVRASSPSAARAGAEAPSAGKS